MQPPVQGRDARAGAAPQQREVQVVAVEVDDVEAGDVLEDQLHQPDVVRQRLPAVRVAPQGPRAGGDQLRRCLRVAAGEQRDLVPQPHQLFGQVGDDTLRAAVQLRRHALIQRGDLCDSHDDSPVANMALRADSGPTCALNHQASQRSSRLGSGWPPTCSFASADARYPSNGTTSTLPITERLCVTGGGGADDALNGPFDEPIVYRNLQPQVRRRTLNSVPR